MLRPCKEHMGPERGQLGLYPIWNRPGARVRQARLCLGGAAAASGSPKGEEGVDFGHFVVPKGPESGVYRAWHADLPRVHAACYALCVSLNVNGMMPGRTPCAILIASRLDSQRVLSVLLVALASALLGREGYTPNVRHFDSGQISRIREHVIGHDTK